jgi:hypothetical protein
MTLLIINHISRLPENPLDIVLAGLRTDAELLRRLLDILPAEEQAARQIVLQEIQSRITQLESLIGPGTRE